LTPPGGAADFLAATVDLRGSFPKGILRGVLPGANFRAVNFFLDFGAGVQPKAVPNKPPEGTAEPNKPPEGTAEPNKPPEGAEEPNKPPEGAPNKPPDDPPNPPNNPVDCRGASTIGIFLTTIAFFEGSWTSEVPMKAV